MHLEKLNVNVPITGDHSVTTLVHVVAKIMQDRLIRRRPHIDVKTVFAEQFVDRASRDGGQEFPFGSDH